MDFVPACIKMQANFRELKNERPSAEALRRIERDADYSAGRGIVVRSPVGFLIAMCVVVLIITLLLNHRPRLTLKGNLVLEHLLRNAKKPGELRSKKKTELSVAPTYDIAMAVALFGVVGLGTQILNANVADLLIHD